MGFKYKEDSRFIVQPKIKAGFDVISEVTPGCKSIRCEVALNTSQLYHVWCFNGRFIVYDDRVRLTLTEKAMNMYFRKC